MSWLPLPSVGTAYSIQILRSNAMLKTYGLAHVSSNINEFIRVVLIFFFFCVKISQAQKVPKALKAQKAPKSLKGTKTLMKKHKRQISE